MKTELTVKEADQISGEMLLWLLKRLGHTSNNTSNPADVAPALSVLSMASSKIFLALRQQMSKGDVVGAFNIWTSGLHETITRPEQGFIDAMRAAHCNMNTLEEAEAWIKSKR